MSKVLPIIEARNRLTKLPDELTASQEVLEVTRRGKPVLAVMPWDVYESIVETLEIMGDESQLAELRRGVKEIKEGKTVSWRKAKKRLGL